MSKPLPRAVRRRQAKADLFRTLARHTQSLVERRRLTEMAENEDRKIFEGLSVDDAWTDLSRYARAPFYLAVAGNA